MFYIFDFYLLFSSFFFSDFTFHKEALLFHYIHTFIMSKHINFGKHTVFQYRAAEPTFKEGGLMNKKRAVSNLLILVSPGGTTTVCTGEKFLKIRVPRLTKIGFLTVFCNLLPNQTNFSL